MGNILLACNGGGEQRASLAPGMLAETEQLLRHRHRADDATVRRVLDYAAAVVEGGEGTCGGCGLVLQLLLVTPCGHLVCPECVPAACVGCPVCAAPFAPVAYTACARCEAAGTPGCDAAHEGRRPRSMGGVDAFVWLQPGFSLDWQAPHYIVHHTVHCMVRVAAAGPRPRLAGDATRRGGAPARAGDAPAACGRGGGGAARQGRRAVERGCASGERAEGARNSPGRRSGCPRCPRDGRGSCDLAGRRLDGAPAAAAAGLDAAAASASVAAAAAAAAARATTKSVRWADGHAASSSDSRAAAASSSLSGTLPPPPPPPPVEAEGVVQRTGFDGGGGDGGDDLSFSKFRHIASRLQALLDTY